MLVEAFPQLEGFPFREKWERRAIHRLVLRRVERVARVAADVDEVAQLDLADAFLLSDRVARRALTQAKWLTRGKRRYARTWAWPAAAA